MLRALCPLFLATVVVCQDAAERCAAALLRGDVEAAAEAATSATDPAERARLQAAVLPPSQRPLAMLMVAARHRDNAQADHAILAGAAAVMVQRGRGESLPGLRRWCVIEDQDDDGAEIVPAPVVVGLWRELEYRRAHGGDLGTLAEAEQLLRFASVSRFGFEPARVLPEQPLSLPERREELLLRAWRRQPGRGGWHELAQLGPADREVLLATDSNAPIPALPAGDWLVELASTATCWRGVRAVEVSDLDVVALADGAGVALGAWRGGQVAGTGQWWFRSGSGERVGGACARGAQVFPRRETGLAGAGELFVQVDGQRALVPLGNGRFGWDNHERWQAHLMVDRPIYRPGDTVMGRLVLREATYEGELLDAVVHTKPAADCEVELRALDEGDRVTLRGRTDAAGVWTFAVPLPEVVATGDMPFEVRTVADGRRIYSGYPGAVAMFRRASLLLDVTGPEQVAAAEDASVELHARWASGAPASAIVAVAKVELRARGRSFPDERHELATDADGKITLQLPLHRLGAKWVHVTFDVHTPQGPKELRHRIQVMQPSSDDDDAPGPRYLTLVPPEIAVVGAPCVVRVQGPADGHALFVAGRGRGARAFQLQFDGAGEASVTVVPTREEWPALDLAVADAENRCSRRVPMLQRAAVAPQITLPERTRPGSAVECRIATGVAGTVVTVAVVDERVFAIAPDRTPEPGAELRPPVHYPQWERTTSAPAMTGAELLGSMLVDGRVPESWYGGSLDRSGGPAGGAGAASPAVGDVRTEFRATAAFVTVVAGPDGVAVAPFTLPDDLTTWRVTLVGVAPDGAAFLERRQVQTRLPLAAEPVLPRVLRAGDTVQMPIAVDRAAGAGSGENVALAATCTGAAAAIEHGEHELAVAGGSAATVPVTLRGAAAGAAELEFAATLGELVDRSRRTLVVSPDAVARPVSAAAMGEGEVGVECPAELAAGAGVDVEVLGGSSAAWAAIDRRLQLYPYGCVEQTLAKLLPFAAAVRGARAHGAPPPIADEQFERRLRAGFARLRRLQHGRGGAFSFWPGTNVDLGMTALVLHGLAAMREGGIDLERFGLDNDPSRPPFGPAIAQLTAREGKAGSDEERLDVELAAACLRFHPQNEGARAAVAAAVAAPQPLPAGVLARCGLALAAAGDAESAGACLRRLDAGERLGAGDPHFPGENPIAVRALQLELQCVLQPKASAAGLAAEVLLGCLDGYSSTYAQGCALGALALALPRRDAQPFVAQVRADATARELTLSPENGFSSSMRLAAPARVTVTAPAGQVLVVRVAGQKLEAGSGHGAWSAPLVVERELCYRRADATPEQVRRDEDLAPIARDRLRAGELVWLRLRVRSAVPLRYVVIDCPLPAGFEPGEELGWFERFDDRLAMTCRRVGSEVQEFVIPVVPTLVGTTVWPPATAAPMYASGSDGGTAGEVLTVLPGVVDPARRSQVSCFPESDSAVTRRGDVRIPSPYERAMSALSDAYVGADAAALLAALDAAIAAGDALAREGEAADLLWDLTELLEEFVGAEPEGRNDARRQVCVALVARQRRCVADVLAAFERDRSGYKDLFYVDELVHGLEAWQDRDQREAMLARVLELAVARRAVPDRVLDEVDGPVEDEHLRAVLLTMLLGDLVDEDERIGELLPPEDLVGIAPMALLDLDLDWPPGTLHRLLDVPVGRAELRRRLSDPDFVVTHSEVLLAELPQAWWRELSLSVWAALEAYDLDGFDLIAQLAEANVTTAELQHELCATRELGWQSVLALALHRRGVRDLGAADPAGDPHCVAWQGALALRDDDAAGALRVLDAFAADSSYADERLEEFLRPIVLRSGDVPSLARVAPDLDDDGCSQVFARLDGPGRRRLLAVVDEELSRLPDAHEVADCGALWAYGERLDALSEVVDALSRTDIGLRWAERCIDELADAKKRDSLRFDLRTACGLDPDTGLAPADEPWLPLLVTVQRSGVPATWTAAERQLYDRLRRLRGVR